MRDHVEIVNEKDLEATPFVVAGMPTDGCTSKQLSLDRESGDGTEEVSLPEGWKAPVGHLNHDLEVLILDGDLDIGPSKLHKYSYSFVPAGFPIGPFEAKTNVKMLWMPAGTLNYSTEEYASLANSMPGAATLHNNAQLHERMTEFVPCIDTPCMSWETTKFLPPGAARKSLRGTVDGAASWILGLCPQWIEGNFFASHPTSEEMYCLEGNIAGHWCYSDDPFNRKFGLMDTRDYCWRPPHIPHGPFYTDPGCMLFFRTTKKLRCDWQIHNPDYSQQHDKKFGSGRVTFHGQDG